MSFWSKKKRDRTPQELRSVATAIAAELVNEAFPAARNYFTTVYRETDAPISLAEGDLAALQREELFFLLHLLHRAAVAKLGPDPGSAFMEFLFIETRDRWSRTLAQSPAEFIVWGQAFELECSERQKLYARSSLPSGKDLKDSLFWEYAKCLASRVKDPYPERVGRLALHGAGLFDFTIKGLDKAFGRD